MRHKESFAEIHWEKPAIGMKEKTLIANGSKIRLIEFSKEFHEKDWCTSSHLGYIISGTLHIEFESGIETVTSGEALHISPGEKHKTNLVVSDTVELILFEKLD